MLVQAVLEIVALGPDDLRPVGSLRRALETVGDVQLLGRLEHPEPAIQALVTSPRVQQVLHRDERSASVMIRDEQVDVRFVPREQYGLALIHYTGSRAHNEELRQLAAVKGWRWTAGGLVAPGAGRPTRAPEEADAYAALGLPFIAPELREDGSEIWAARDGALPPLVDRPDILGDLHMHTDRSDGRDPLDRMVAAARSLGYRYIAITDHSQSANCQRTLSVEDLRRQADEIAALRERTPGLTILHGAEVEILRDGRLDYPDPVLERLDIVLASLHDHGGDSPTRLTERFLAAIRHPLVNVITHPLNRTVGRRAAY
jgi:DNA polymerase (family 10)